MNEMSENCTENVSRPLDEIKSKEKLWDAIIEFQNY